MTSDSGSLLDRGPLPDSTVRIFATRCGFDEATARRWWAAGLGPYEAERALQAGHSLEQAAAHYAAARRARAEAEQSRREQQAAAQAFRERCGALNVRAEELEGTGIEPEQLAPWLGRGLRTGDIVALLNAGATTRHRNSWARAGFPLKAVVRFVKRGTPAGQVARLHAEELQWASISSKRRSSWRALGLPVAKVLELEQAGLWPIDFVRGRATPGTRPTVWHDAENSPMAWSDTAEKLFDNVESRFGIDLRGSSASFLEGFGFSVSRTTRAERWLALECPGEHVVVAADGACFRVVGGRGGSVRIEEPAGDAPNETVAVVERLDSWEQAFAQFADRVPQGADVQIATNLECADLCRVLDVWAAQLTPGFGIDINGRTTRVTRCTDGFSRFFPDNAFEDWDPPPGITTVFASEKSGYDARVVMFGDLLAWSENLHNEYADSGVIGRISSTVDPLTAAQPHAEWFGIRNSGRPVAWVLTGDEIPDFVRRWSGPPGDTGLYWEIRNAEEAYYWFALFTAREGDRVIYEDQSFSPSMAWDLILTCNPGDRYETSDESWLLEHLRLSGTSEDYPDTVGIELNGRQIELEVADLVLAKPVQGQSGS